MMPLSKKLRLLGSDLMINAYAANFKVDDDDEEVKEGEKRKRKPNTNVIEANYFNRRLFDALSVLKVADDVDSKDVLIMATSLSQKNYGDALRTYKRRLGLDPNSEDDLYVLVNVSMSPLPTQANFIGTMAKGFTDKAKLIVMELQWRNLPGSDHHSFVIQGSKQLYFTYIPNFNTIRSRRQVIFTADVPAEVLQKYNAAQAKFPGSNFTLHTAEFEDLEKLLKKENFSFKAVIKEGVPKELGMYVDPTSGNLVDTFELTNGRVIKSRSLDPEWLDQEYPDRMPFYLYGSLDDEVHLEHILRKHPNAQLSSSNVKLDLKYDHTSPVFGEKLKGGVIAVLDWVFERAMHPFTEGHEPNFFAYQKTFQVKVFEDAVRDPAAPYKRPFEANCGLLLAIGEITLGSRVYKDYAYINMDHTASLRLDEWLPDQEEFASFLGKPTEKPYDEYHSVMQQRNTWKTDMISKGIGSSYMYQE